MEKFTNSIKDSSSYMNNSSPTSYSDPDFNDLGDSIKSTTPTTWLIIILILTFLGFNIFVYLAKGSQGISDFFAPIINTITSIFGGVTGQVVSVSAEGSKALVSTAAQGTQSAVGATADVVNAGLTGVQQVAQPGQAQGQPSQQTQSSLKNQPVNSQQVDIMQANTLNRALNTSTSQKQQVNGEDYQADDSTSSIQMSSTTGKAGWCYIGEERGFRTCAEVGVNDTCMSGNIFPSQQICVNPNLRQ
jgi:outer membrane protein W